MAAIIAIIIAYLLGSVSTSILLAKYLKQPDPRSMGSGSAGATNVMRNFGKNQALIVLIGDALKGFLAVLIARIIGVHGVMLGFTAVAAVIGHIFPLYFKFKGGKGVATGFGALLMLSFWAAIIAAIAWGVFALVFRYVSLASMVAAVVAPLSLLIIGAKLFVFPVFIIAALIIWKHRENIDRIRAGTEPKI